MKIRVQPGARKTEIAGLHDGSLKIKINAPPEDGKANKALCDFLAKSLGIAKSRVSIVRGHTSRDKVIAVEGFTAEQILAKLL